MHPGAWIVWAACAGWVAFATTNPFYLVMLLAVAWVINSAHQREGPGARSFKVFLLFGLWAMGIRTALVFLGTVDASSVTLALFEGFRLGVLLAVFGTFNSVTDPFGVLRFAPRRFHEPALAAALALSLAPRTIEATGRVREAQRGRGIEIKRLRTLPAVAVPVLATGMDRALSLAESMDARGHGRGTRTRYRPQPWTTADVAVALGSTCRSILVRVGGHDSRRRTVAVDVPVEVARRRSVVVGLRAAPSHARLHAEGTVVSAVSFEHVSFAYPDEPGFVLHDVTLSIPDGTLTLVVGPTGSGKSTFLRAINGLRAALHRRTLPREGAGGRALDPRPRAPGAGGRGGVRPPGSGRVLRSRSGRGRTRVRDGEPRGR